MALSSRFISRRLFSSFRSLSSAARMSTAATANTPSSPWLMLPPSFNTDTNTIDHRFYSFAQTKVLTLPQKTDDLGLTTDFRLIGSSHGWLALFNPTTLDSVLYNPISLRHVTLPPVRELPTKLILSSSPDDENQNCRAVVIYNSFSDLAYCSPVSSEEWAPIIEKTEPYKDFIHDPTRKNLFLGLSKGYDLETWDLSDTSSPRLVETVKTEGGERCPPPESLGHMDSVVEHLVVSDDRGLLFLVKRFLHQDNPHWDCPHMTCGFDALAYDHREGGGRFRKLGDEGFGGDLTLFVGRRSDSVALSTGARFPEFMTNAIYFTGALEPSSLDASFCGHHYDFGISNFEKDLYAVAGCCIPFDVGRQKDVVPSTTWFFPTLSSASD